MGKDSQDAPSSKHLSGKVGGNVLDRRHVNKKPNYPNTLAANKLQYQ